MKRLIVTLLGFVAAVPIQDKPIYGRGTEIFVGTPAQRYVVGVEFGSSDFVLFAGADVRSPFDGPLVHSSSLHPLHGGRRMTLAGVHFETVPVILERDFVLASHLHSSDAHGILGLGPESRFALERIIAIREAHLLFPSMNCKRGYDLEMLTRSLRGRLAWIWRISQFRSWTEVMDGKSMQQSR